MASRCSFSPLQWTRKNKGSSMVQCKPFASELQWVDAVTLARIISQPLPRWTLLKVPQSTCSPLRKRVGHLDEPLLTGRTPCRHTASLLPTHARLFWLSSHSTCAETKQQPAGMSGMRQGSRSLAWALDRPVSPCKRSGTLFVL